MAHYEAFVCTDPCVRDFVYETDTIDARGQRVQRHRKFTIVRGFVTNADTNEEVGTFDVSILTQEKPKKGDTIIVHRSRSEIQGRPEFLYNGREPIAAM